jgi:hypothetical protein
MTLVMAAKELLLLLAEPRHEQKVPLLRAYVQNRDFRGAIRVVFQQKELTLAITLDVNHDGRGLAVGQFDPNPCAHLSKRIIQHY